jgi:hypothetical protein
VGHSLLYYQKNKGVQGKYVTWNGCQAYTSKKIFADTKYNKNNNLITISKIISSRIEQTDINIV